MKRPRILLADDHQMVAEGLRSLLEPDFELVEILANGRELVSAAERHQPDVIVADISMPLLNGFEAIEHLRRNGCPARVVFLTMHNDPTYAAKALDAGANGFVLKHSASSELIQAISAALKGERFLSQNLTVAPNKALSRPSWATDAQSLTPRQREVLQLFAEGYSAREVAAILDLSTRTAENHKARIMSLLGLRSTAELVQYAIRHGVINCE